MTPSILVAGIGNIFLGDDGFGVEVARRLVSRTVRDRVRVVDFGIRGLDLSYALLEEYDAVIFVDIAPRGHPPGTLSVIVPGEHQQDQAHLDAHGMDPVKVLKLAQDLGAPARPTYIVACEPQIVLDGENSPDVLVELSPSVAAAIEPAVEMVEKLIDELCGAAAL